MRVLTADFLNLNNRMQEPPTLTPNGSPPANLEAEISIIGSLLIDGGSILRVVQDLRPEHFYGEHNREIYAACCELFGESTGIDQETVRNRLNSKGILEDVGGDAYLSAAVAHTPHAVHIADYGKIVRAAFMLRLIGDVGLGIHEIGTDLANIKDVDAALKQAEELIFQVGREHDSADFVPIKDARSIAEFFDPPAPDSIDGSNQPIATGFQSLDQVLGGFHRSDMIVLAARPGFGKSTLALNVGLNAAKNGMTVGIFSLEMGIDQVAHRMAAAHAHINIQNIRNDHLTPPERDRLSDAYGYLSDMRIYVDDAALQTASGLSAKARRLKLQTGLDFLIVDYMQLISGSSSGREANRVQEVSEISRHLKAIARDLNIPVLAVSQLNRAVEQRSSHEPKLADLRESGSIEQDADVVMFIHRNDKNMSEDEWNRRNPTQVFPRGLTDIIIAKHRHGPTSTVEMSVRDEWGLFSSVTEPGMD